MEFPVRRYNEIVSRMNIQQQIVDAEFNARQKQWEIEKAARKQPKPNNLSVSDTVAYQLYPIDENILNRGDLRTYLESFQRMLWVFVGVNTIASNAAIVPGKVFEKQNGKMVEVHDHDILNLFEYVNEIYTECDLKHRTFAFIELTGNAYWFLHKTRVNLNGQTYSKILLPRPDGIEPKLISDDLMAYYQNNESSVPSIYPNEDVDVAHFMNCNTVLSYAGYPTIAAGGNNLLLDWYLELYGNQFFKVGVQPTMAFKVPGRMSEASEERFRADLRRLHEGVSNMFRTLILQNGMEAEDMSMKSPVDTQYVETKKSTRDNVLMNLGCYHLVALLQERSGESIKLAHNMFWEETMVPRLCGVEDRITKSILRKYPKSNKLYYKYDTRQVRGLRDDLLDESLAYFRMIQSEIMGHKEVREKMGLPRDLEPDDTTGLGYQPALSRTLSNDERALTEESMNRIQEKRDQLKN